MYTYNSQTDSYSAIRTTAKYSSIATYYTCVDSIEDQHYRLKADMYNKACVSASLNPCKLYTANKYYYYVTDDKIGYELDTSPLGHYEITYQKSNLGFDETQTYYIKNDNGDYVVVPLTQSTYEPDTYYVTVLAYPQYYQYTSNEYKPILRPNECFYAPGQYYYLIDDAYYLDNTPTVTANRDYYNIVPVYVMRDDLNAYSRGAT